MRHCGRNLHCLPKKCPQIVLWMKLALSVCFEHGDKHSRTLLSDLYSQGHSVIVCWLCRFFSVSILPAVLTENLGLPSVRHYSSPFCFSDWHCCTSCGILSVLGCVCTHWLGASCGLSMVNSSQTQPASLKVPAVLCYTVGLGAHCSTQCLLQFVLRVRIAIMCWAVGVF